MIGGIVTAKGTVHGKTIELEQESGFPEGQKVSVVMQAARPAGEGLRAAFGASAQDRDELDQFVEKVYRDRDDDRPEPRQ